ncbi:MAG: malate dehydrogenase [Candidatus Dasytiphilus stammeri]
MKISIIGAAGNIGQIISLILKIKLFPGSVLNLYDISPAIFGIALDLSHIPNSVQVQGFNQIEPALYTSDIVIITAGVARKPGMDRLDLFHANASIVYTLSKKIALICPKSLIMVITNPLNTILPIVAEVLKRSGCYNPKKLFGITTLDVIRANAFITEVKGQCLSSDVKVIGGHSSRTILPLLSHISDISFTEQEVINITRRVRNAGTEVVKAKVGHGSASLAMGYAASRWVFSLLKALNGASNIIECAYIEGDGKYAKFFAQPFILGTQGIAEFLPIEPLSSFEKNALDEVIRTLKEEIQIGEEFIKNKLED